jgi:hypothetical protein
LEKFDAIRKGKSESTKDTDASIIKRLKAEWKRGMDSRRSLTSQIDLTAPQQLDATGD